LKPGTGEHHESSDSQHCRGPRVHDTCAFRRQSSGYFQNYPAQDQESNARSRILALTEYLYRLQAK
jgi:hypothetical protein